MRDDCRVWLEFLGAPDDQLQRLCHPFVDLNEYVDATTLNFYTDASKRHDLDFGCTFEDMWTYGQWSKGFIRQQDPSIEFLELYALCIGVLTWGHLIQNTRVIIVCDNQAVVSMVNNSTSKCEKCMRLIRMLVKNCLVFNRRIFVKYIRTDLNVRADALSRLQFKRFWKNSPETTQPFPSDIHESLTPIEKVWF